MYISKSKRSFNVKSWTYYFHMKAKILADFQVCISVPLNKNSLNFEDYIPVCKRIYTLNKH